MKTTKPMKVKGGMSTSIKVPKQKAPKPAMPKVGKAGKPMAFNKGGKVKGYC